MTTIKAPSTISIIAGQFGATLVLTLAGLALADVATGLSLGLGGIICWVANTVFTVKAFRYRGVSATQKIVKEFVSGEAYKILLSVAGFALVFIYVPAASPLLVFLGYIGVLLVGLGITMFVVASYTQSVKA